MADRIAAAKPLEERLIKHFLELYDMAPAIDAAEARDIDLSETLEPSEAARTGPLMAAQNARTRLDDPLEPQIELAVRAAMRTEPVAGARLALAGLASANGTRKADIEIWLTMLGDRGATVHEGDVFAVACRVLNSVTGNVRLKEDEELFNRLTSQDALRLELNARWQRWWAENRDYLYLSPEERRVGKEGSRRVFLVNEEAKAKRKPVDERTGRIIPK